LALKLLLAVAGTMALSIDSLRPLLASALQWPGADVGGYLDALQSRGLLPADDAPLEPAHAALVILALVSGFPAPEAVNAAIRLAAFCSADGAVLLHVLTDLMGQMRAGDWFAPEGGRLFQLRRVLGPKTDVAVLDAFYREGGRSQVGGIYFAPATSTRPATLGASLTLQIEMALSWLLVEEIAAQLGPVPSDAAADSAVTAAEAPQPGNVIMH
jgi:hypothetical protein